MSFLSSTPQRASPVFVPGSIPIRNFSVIGSYALFSNEGFIFNALIPKTPSLKTFEVAATNNRLAFALGAFYLHTQFHTRPSARYRQHPLQ
ncbi:hypothetical protein LEP1GSC112_0439 [Leptospira interrogans serovar Pomona str. UT364]|nr:hypothetical protein LEP1GSC110_3576 [Leptospira interrogans serovar Medanensis str. UT053]EMO00886.1 hypothetical protein LEP1GSC112_0439 [Leptospira interrogans serovar Pomona str. UT364]